MAQYQLKAGQWTATTLPAQVGNKYNLGVADPAATVVNPDGTTGTGAYYGYVFRNDPQQGGMQEASDVATKNALINYGSPNLVDRDLTFYPRVSQGDFSGGGFQLILNDFTRYFDSDLEIRTAGYVILRPAWERTSAIATGLVSPVTQVTTLGTTTYFTYGGSLLYDGSGASHDPSMGVRFVDSDGWVAYVADGAGAIKTWNGSAFFSFTSGVGSMAGIWFVDEGTNGRFLYATNSTETALNKFDCNATPPVTPVPVPLNGSFRAIIDIAPYQNGIALLTHDYVGAGNSTVWFHDGTNMTRIVTIDQYQGVGIVNCLGDLYLTAQSSGGYEPPLLIKLSAGSYQPVAWMGLPLTPSNTSAIGYPVATGQYVYFGVTNPQVNNITTTGYVVVYDALTGAVSHIGNMDANDVMYTAQPRQLGVNGRAVAYPMVIGTSGYLQFQTNSTHVPSTGSPVPLYTSSGWMVSSHIDFSTPGVAKRFRRIEFHHSPLNPGESIVAKAFVDQDPITFSPSATPNPSTATVTHTYNAAESSTTASLTTLTFGQDTVGKTLYYAFQLNAGTNQQTTPKMTYTAVEVGGTWTWTFMLDNTAIRRCLDGNVDNQGVTGKDLDYLFRNSYENGTTLTLYFVNDASGNTVSYSVAVESRKARTPSYVNHQTEQASVRADEEWITEVVLRQIA